MDNGSRLIDSSTMASGESQSARTVLIVDDDEEIRHALRLLCEAEDMDVALAELGIDPRAGARQRRDGSVGCTTYRLRISGR